MQRPARGAQAGRHHRVRVGAHGRGHPGGERGCGQFMVGQQHKRDAQGALEPVVRRPRAQLSPQPPGQAAGAGRAGVAVQAGAVRAGTGAARADSTTAGAIGRGRLGLASRGQAVHQARHDRLASRDHGGRVKLQAQRVRGGQGRDDHAETLQRQGAGRQRRLGRPACPQRGLGGPPGAAITAGEFPGPQQPGGVLELVPGREGGDVQAAVTGAVAGDLGQRRLDDELARPRVTGPPSPGQRLDLPGIEQAGPPILPGPPPQDSPADI